MGKLNKPILSIITINLNNADALLLTINSVINQTNTSYEYIIIDGGSNDDSINIINQYKSYISYYKSEKDKGIYCAMNKGIKVAKGEYCLFLNSGDLLYDKAVVSQLEIENLTADIINFNVFVTGKYQNKTIVPSKKDISFYTFYKHTIIHQATLIKRELFSSVGFYNESLVIVADWEFFMKALFINNCTYQSSNIILSIFDSDGISSKPENRAIALAEKQKILELYFGRFLKDYKLIINPSTFKYLAYINSSAFLKTIFIIKIRIINKILSLFIKIE